MKRKAKKVVKTPWYAGKSAWIVGIVLAAVAVGAVIF